MIAGAALAYYRFVAGPMEGTSWEIKLKADAFFALPRKDKLVFERGKLRAEGYEATGFAPAVYSEREVGGDVDALWSAALTDERRGTMTWHGLVRGDVIEGVAILHGKDGQKKRFTFSGRRA